MATDFTTREASQQYSKGVLAEELSLKPVLLDMIDAYSPYDRPKSFVLDLGCGDGRYSVQFANRGAFVDAVDFSQDMIDIAKERHPHADITYLCGDIISDSVIQGYDISNKTYKLVFMNMVIPDITNPQGVDVLFEKIRAMTQQGSCIFSMLHPLYTSPQQDASDRARDFSPRQYFEEGSTYKADAQLNDGEVMEFNETHFSLEHICAILHKNGFLIRRIRESKAVPHMGIFLPKYIVFEMV